MATHGIPGRWKDDVTLPLEGGWRWDGDWEVDPSWIQSGASCLPCYQKIYSPPSYLDFGVFIQQASYNIWIVLVFAGAGVDDDGWRYRKMNFGDHESEVGIPVRVSGKGSSVGDGTLKRTASGSRSWTSTCTPDCVCRQRRWIRKRRRRPCYPDLISQPSIGSEVQRQESSPETLKNLDSGNPTTYDQPQQCEGMVLIASLLCACLRNVKLPQARRGTIQLLKEASSYIDDDARLQHVIPYVVALLSDSAAIVRCTALQTLCDVLSLVQVFFYSSFGFTVVNFCCCLWLSFCFFFFCVLS